MHTPTPAHPHEALSRSLGEIESCLSAMDAAFHSGDVSVLEARSRAVQDSLAGALQAFAQAARQQADELPPLPEPLRLRLSAAQARLVSQQVAVHRALHAYGRTLGALFPQVDAPSTFGVGGPGSAAQALRAYR